MNKAKKIISILFSLDFLQYAFFFVVTARLFMSLQPTSTNAVYVFSVYALIVLLYQFWRNPTRLKGSKNLLLMLFMLSYAVTIVLNSKDVYKRQCIQRTLLRCWNCRAARGYFLCRACQQRICSGFCSLFFFFAKSL